MSFARGHPKDIVVPSRVLRPGRPRPRRQERRLAFDPRVRIRVHRAYSPFLEEAIMSSTNRISEPAIVGPPPSTNGKPPTNRDSAGRGSLAGRGSPDPAHTPDRRSPEPPPSSNGSPAPEPSSNGRDALGQYSKGNPGGPGNPFARLVAELRKAAIEAVPREKLRAIFVKMSDLALEGNVQAAKFVTWYLYGQQAPAPDPDRVDVEEWSLMKEEAPMMKELQLHGKVPDPILPLTCARSLREVTTNKQAGMLSVLLGMGSKERDSLLERGKEYPYEVCNLLRDKAKNLNAPPSTNGKRKKHARR